MKRAFWMCAVGLIAVGCADSGRDGSSSSTSRAGPSTPATSPATGFADVVNDLCNQRAAAIGDMRRVVYEHVVRFGVSPATKTYAVSSIGFVRDQIPLLRAAPDAPPGWDALVDEYEQRTSASTVAAVDAAAVAYAWYDPLRDLDARAYQFGATSCPTRLHDGTPRTAAQESYAVAAHSLCMDLLVDYAAAWFAADGGFTFGAERLEPELSDDRVEHVSSAIAQRWATTEPTLRAVAASGTDEATVTQMIDAIDQALAVFPDGELAARKDALDGPAFEALDDTDLQRFGLLPCTFRDYL